ncbi:2-dehydropantoate 2-reductase [Aeribacillus composti]|uniref:ketopantoate reductase family protein n=1 Tax=Aeribacillus composti TaxID=1868734 RepID=UPI002E1E9417|nr:2-dehydropantoate 2-reductase [Aeribacillus composti]MED0746837.1 2-dehydropantoate 2-reductase [Aeribacillus composti]
MKIAVAGAGAVGGYFGALLKKAGHDVVFLARGKHLEAMKKSGLVVKTNDQLLTIDGVFTDKIEDFADCELILFCVKSTDTESTAEQIASLQNDRAVVLTLQNGVDNEEKLAQILGGKRLLSAATYLSSHVEEPGVIKHSGRAKLVIGALDESLISFRDKVADLFRQAEIFVKTTDDIMLDKWKKLLWNATFNPLAALSKATVGEIMEHKELRKTAENACREVMRVANKIGIPLDEEMFYRTFANSGAALKHKPSMLQDRLKGKRMEIESLCGFIVKKGRQIGVETPVLQTLYSNLLFLETHR